MYQINSYREAESVEQAVAMMRRNPNSMLIAGGTDILIKARERDKNYIGRDMVGINRVAALKEITEDRDGAISIGACASFTDIEQSNILKKQLPLLLQAAGTVGGPQIRNMATIGGNICNGMTSADSAPPLLALNAILRIVGIDGIREVAIKDFYLGGGRVALNAAEIVTAVKIPRTEWHGYHGHYIKFARRKAMDIAILSCCALIKVEYRRISDLRISFGVAAPVPVRAPTAERFAAGMEYNDELLQEIGRRCLDDVRPRDSWRGSKHFRERLVTVLPRRAIQAAVEQMTDAKSRNEM